jgi:hypothetical protein
LTFARDVSKNNRIPITQMDLEIHVKYASKTTEVKIPFSSHK